ncbi:MAG: sugar ABC transporter ATP-binding protein [Xanthobacteraceae bacterium]|nr:sugar ABC transporter ATP-binding protein [Xanthobacteraceae bacterium]
MAGPNHPDRAVPSSAGLAVDVRHVSKHYRGALALEDISLTVAMGEIHGFVGENGAGKSTLGKIIAGAVTPDAGEIAIEGKAVRHRSPRGAIRMGITLIDQELATVPAMSVLDNVFLGSERHRAELLDRAAQRRRFAELADRIGLTSRPQALAGTLPIADQQKIEIMRALVRKARLIVMDEPTAALSRAEADRLLGIARDLRTQGVTIIFVSHTLEDVLSLSDRVTVLKDGRLIKTSAAAHETVASLITSMLGRSMDVVFPPSGPPPTDAPVLLRVRGLSRPPAFTDISFDVRAGEIVGFAGLVGSGRSEIARAVFGADRATGAVEVDGKSVRGGSPQRSIRRGIAMLPESRKEQGLAMHRSVIENVTMVHLDRVCRRGVVSRREERSVVDEMLRNVDARVASSSLPVSALSGGNQQKVALAKWLVRRPRLLIADEPTRGVDVGAKLTIYALIRSLAAQGTGILLISSELEEVLGLSDRVLVLRTGRIVAEYADGAIDEAAVMRSAFGASKPESILHSTPISHGK